MTDFFSSAADSVSAPARRAVVVTPHDSNALTDIPKALYVGTGGNIAMRGIDGTADQVWKTVVADTILPFGDAPRRQGGRRAPVGHRRCRWDGTVDAEARIAVAAVLAALRGHDLIAP